MSQQSSGFFTSFDESKIYFQKWSRNSAKATLIITHGHGEHLGCYHRLTNALESLPLEIIAWDLRGHGKSDGIRGYAEHFQDYVKDFETFLMKLTQEMKLTSKPVFFLSHSMGGLIQTKLLCERPLLPIAGQILSAPLFGFSVHVPKYKETAALWLEQFLPKMTLGNELANEDLTRDIDVLREYENDALRHNRISSGVYLGSLKAISEVRAMASRISTPTLLVMSEKDPVVSNPDAAEIFERLDSKDKKIIYYPERKHELFNDLGREIVFSDLKNWLESRIS